MATIPSAPDDRPPSPEFDALLRAAAERALGAAPDEAAAEAAFRRVMDAASDLSAATILPAPVRTRRRSPFGPSGASWTTPMTRWVLGGVTAALGIVGAVVAFRHANSSGDQAPTHFGARYATATAQRATITLDDGTRVTLAPQSTLRVATEYGRDTRDVTLDGEAYFDVRGSHERPFLVRTGGVTTRVLGTTFSVRRYVGDARVQVAVTSGKVLVSSGRSSAHALHAMTLAAGSVAAATDSTVVLLSADSAQAYTTWTNGQLVFRAAPMTDVLATLSRWYGYRFRLADSALAQQNLTAVLDAESSAKAFSTIKLLLNIDFAFDGDIVTLRSHAPHSSPDTRRRDGSPVFTTPHVEVGR